MVRVSCGAGAASGLVMSMSYSWLLYGSAVIATALFVFAIPGRAAFSTPADGTHNLHAIQFLQDPLRPQLRRHHLAVDRHGEAQAEQIQRGDEAIDRLADQD